MTPEEAVRRYYRTIDDGDYESLAALLHAEFTHYRPDRTLSGRETFVEFMTEDRPRTDTVHAVEAVYLDADVVGTGASDDADDRTDEEVAVRGRLCGEDGDVLFGFVDVFGFRGEAVRELRTYTGSLADE